MREPKQVLVVRKDLKMRKGKIAAQCAHASLLIFLEKADTYRDKDNDLSVYRISAPTSGALDTWVQNSFAKICVYVTSEEELLSIHNKAKEAGVPSSLVTDQGRTELHGVPTTTVVAVGPGWPEDIDPITGDLPLL